MYMYICRYHEQAALRVWERGCLSESERRPSLLVFGLVLPPKCVFLGETESDPPRSSKSP